jgi:hypothetical protein
MSDSSVTQKYALGPFPPGPITPGPSNSIPAYLIPSTTETKVDTDYNIAIGFNALVNNSNISYNMNDGNYSLLPNSTGVNNTAIGDSSLHETKGKNNTALGYKTGISNILGNNNTFLGNSADCVGNNLNNSTAIGYKSKITSSNQIVLGNSDIEEIILGSANAEIKIGTASLTKTIIESFATKSYVSSEISDLVKRVGKAINILEEIACSLDNSDNSENCKTTVTLVSVEDPSGNNFCFFIL